MNVSVLQKLVEDDMSSGKTPTIVIAYAGNFDVSHDIAVVSQSVS